MDATGGDECTVTPIVVLQKRMGNDERRSRRQCVKEQVRKRTTMICDDHLGIRAVTPDTLRRAGQGARYSRSPQACAKAHFSDMLQTLHWVRSKTANNSNQQQPTATNINQQL